MFPTMHALWCLLHGFKVWQLWCLLMSCISGVVHRWVNSFTVNILRVSSDKCRCHYPCKLVEKEGVWVFLSGTFSDDQWFKNKVRLHYKQLQLFICWQMGTVCEWLHVERVYGSLPCWNVQSWRRSYTMKMWYVVKSCDYKYIRYLTFL